MSQESPPLDPVHVSSSPEDRFEEFLYSRGMRNTAQRRALLKQVFSKHEHFDAEQLMEQLPAKGDKGHVSRPTVYRTLTEFVDAGLLRTFDLNGRTVYEHDYGYPQHDHLFCVRCQKLIEFQSPRLIQLRNEVAAEANFQVHHHRLIIQGICEGCRKKQRRVRKPVDMV